MAEDINILSVTTTTGSKLSDLEIRNGQLIFVRDKHKLAFDFDDKRVIYKEIIDLATEASRTSLLAPVSGCYYFVVETETLWTYRDGEWIRVGTDGGYYTPEVSSEGVLTWTSTKSDMPTVGSTNIKGDRGDPGVYIGNEEPDDPTVLVWIDEDGEPDGVPEGITQEDIQEAVDNFLTRNPVTGGATTEQAAQIQKNKEDIEYLKQNGDGKAATIKIGTVTTLSPGSNATVTNSGTATDAVLDFRIPGSVKYVRISFNVLSGGDWVENAHGFYEKDIEVPEMPDADGDVRLDVSGISASVAEAYRTEYKKIWDVKTYAGGVTVQALSIPTMDLKMIAGVYELWEGNADKGLAICGEAICGQITCGG